MQRDRPAGVKFVASILFIEAALLLTSATAIFQLSPQHSSAYVLFLEKIPYFRNGPLAADPWMAVIALAVGTWSLAKGLGIWFMKQWARTLILIDLACRFSGFLPLIWISDRKDFGAFTSNPDFAIGFVINLLALLVLAESSTAKAFEDERS